MRSRQHRGARTQMKWKRARNEIFVLIFLKCFERSLKVWLNIVTIMIPSSPKKLFNNGQKEEKMKNMCRICRIERFFMWEFFFFEWMSFVVAPMCECAWAPANTRDSFDNLQRFLSFSDTFEKHDPFYVYELRDIINALLKAYCIVCFLLRQRRCCVFFLRSFSFRAF